MRFEILGPLRVQAGAGEVAVTAGRERSVLAMLLLHAGGLVRGDQLADAVWSPTPPPTARNQLQTCVSALRQRLVKAGGSPALITTEPGGYRFAAEPAQVDLLQFRALLAEARNAVADGQPPQARERYRTVIELSRGPVLADIDSIEVSRIAATINEEVAQAIEERVELELTLGGGGELVAELTVLVGRHPFRERLHAALIRALYRAGRQADAMAAYRRIDRLLREELGTEPGAELQRLHQAVLNRDASLEPPPPPAASSTSPPPRELPGEPHCFVGRARELDRLRAVLGAAADRTSRRRSPVAVLYGPGGVGKSALAVRVGHELAAHYPDGQLYVDLCGSTPGLPAAAAADVLGRFLRRLGVAPVDIPAEASEAAALLRTLTADRRLLFLLDNAADHDQVAPLLPGGVTCGVLVTSRRPLPSVDADERVRVTVLDDEAGLALLSGLTERAGAEASAAQLILTLCGGLPLALRIVAGRLACRPDLSMADYASRLADESGRLDELELDDLAVRASIRTSYDGLRTGGGRLGSLAARAFRMLGLLQVPSVAPPVVAALLHEAEIAPARAALDQLVDAQLLEALPGGRYRLHDLVRLVAAERAQAEEPAAARDEAIERAIAFYTTTLWQATGAVWAGRVSAFGAPPLMPGLPTIELADVMAARGWIDAELPSMLTAYVQVTEMAHPVKRRAIWLAEELWAPLEVRCKWTVAYQVGKRLLEAAGGDEEMEAAGAFAHARGEASFGNYAAAEQQLQRARSLLQKCGNDAGVAIATNGLGLIAQRCGRAREAMEHYTEALHAATQQGLHRLVRVLHSNLSACHISLGEPHYAREIAIKGTVLARREGDIGAECSALVNLVAAYVLSGSCAEAIQCADEAIERVKFTGDWMRECEALLMRSEAKRRLGRLTQAAIDAEDTASLAQACGYRFIEVSARYQSRRLSAQMASMDGTRNGRSPASWSQLQPTDVYRDPVIEALLKE